MKTFKKTFWAVALTIMLSGCGFTQIKSDSEIIKPDPASTTTTNQTLEVPPVTEPPAETTPSGSQSTEPSDEPVSPYPIEMVATANVNARKEPSTSGEIVQIVSEGTVVSAIGYSDGWYKVEVDGQEVYIIENFLSENNQTEE